MSIFPLDQQKCPLDKQKCPFVHWTNRNVHGTFKYPFVHWTNRNVHWTFKCPFVHWTNRNVHWTFKCPFVHWTNGHCLMASTPIHMGSDSVKLRHYSFLGIVNVTCPLDIYKCLHSSIGRTEMSIGHI